MKKLFSLKMRLLGLLILISTILIYNINNKNNINYLSLGDSYSLGKNSYFINEYSYSDYLKDYLKQDNLLKKYVNNYSEDNKDINSLLNDVLCNKKAQKDGKEINLKEELREADLLTLSIGITDIKNKLITDNLKINIVMDQIINDYNNLIKEIKRYYKKDIYVIGYPNVNQDSYYEGIAIRRLNNYLKTNKDIIYISVEELELNKNKYFINNNNFYNNEGYKLIASKIYEKYKKA